jgi:hypothetical protein
VAQPADGKSVASGTAYRALVRIAARFAARRRALRRQIYEIVEIGRGDDRASRLFDAFIIGLIALNIAAFMAETVPELSAAYGLWFRAFEAFSVTIFTIEYGLRLWTAVEMPFLARMPPWRARLHLATRGYLIIDLLAILPFYLGGLLGLDRGCCACCGCCASSSCRATRPPCTPCCACCATSSVR